MTVRVQSKNSRKAFIFNAFREDDGFVVVVHGERIYFDHAHFHRNFRVISE